MLGHLISVLRKLEVVVSGRPASEIPHVITGVADDGWLDTFRRTRAAMERAWADDAVLDRTLILPWDEMTGRAVAAAYAMEFIVHGWDLAKAVDAVERLDPELAEAALPTAKQVVAADGRDGSPFEPARPVPSEAEVYDRLAGWVGRRPGWTPAVR